MDRAHPASELERRQGAAWLDHQGGQHLSARAAGGGRDGGRAPCAAQQRQAALAGTAARTQEAQGGRGGAGEQERPDHLGNDDKRRELSRDAGCLKTRARWRYQSWKGHE